MKVNTFISYFFKWSNILESKKRTGKKTRTTKRTPKKKKGLFTAKKIKPKVKLDTNKVLWFCIIVSISCILLLVAALYLPELNHNSENLETEAVTVQSVETEKKDSKNKTEIPSDAKQTEKKQKQNEKKPVEKTTPDTSVKKPDPVVQKPRDTASDSVQNPPKTETKSDTPVVKEPVKKEEPKVTVTPDSSFNFPKAVNNAQIVFLLDDGGQNLSQAEKFTSLQMPLTIAVLPQLAYSKQVAQKVRGSGKELMLHQPMQSVSASVNPGPGAIKPDMSDSEIRSVLAKNIDEVGPVAGMNNHEGSGITADAHKMEVILKYASDNGVFFLDSRTNKDTQVPYVSNALGYSYYERNGLFIDNKLSQEDKDKGYTMRSKALEIIKKNIDKANKEGVVIMIGHVWSADWLAQLLKDIYPELKAKGYNVTTVSKCRGKK